MGAHHVIVTGAGTEVSEAQWEDDGLWSRDEGAATSDDGSDEGMESYGDAGRDLEERVEGGEE